jgi:hypothetical protein
MFLLLCAFDQASDMTRNHQFSILIRSNAFTAHDAAAFLLLSPFAAFSTESSPPL